MRVRLSKTQSILAGKGPLQELFEFVLVFVDECSSPRSTVTANEVRLKFQMASPGRAFLTAIHPNKTVQMDQTR